MKRAGIMHAELAGRMAALGHTDTIAVTDVGLPVPAGVPMVDLAVVPGVPTFAQVLDALLDELVVQEHTYADEVAGREPGEVLTERANRMGEARTVSHEQFKQLVGGCVFVVRTGANTPYANVILHCGVPF